MKPYKVNEQSFLYLVHRRNVVFNLSNPVDLLDCDAKLKTLDLWSEFILLLVPVNVVTIVKLLELHHSYSSHSVLLAPSIFTVSGDF